MPLWNPIQGVSAVDVLGLFQWLTCHCEIPSSMWVPVMFWAWFQWLTCQCEIPFRLWVPVDGSGLDFNGWHATVKSHPGCESSWCSGLNFNGWHALWNPIQRVSVTNFSLTKLFAFSLSLTLISLSYLISPHPFLISNMLSPRYFHTRFCLASLHAFSSFHFYIYFFPFSI